MIWSIPIMWQFPELFLMFLPPGHSLLPTFPSFRPMGMVGGACLPSNAYYSQMPDYTLYSMSVGLDILIRHSFMDL